MRDVGGVLRPGYELAATQEELMKYPGFGKDINAARAEARKLLAEAGVKDLKFKFLNRNVPMPYTPVGVFLIDQWRQIGVTVEHEQPETRAYIRRTCGAATTRSASTSTAMHVDDPNLQLLKVHLGQASRRSITAATTTTSWTSSTRSRSASSTPRSAMRCCASSSSMRSNEAYTIPTIWWHRIIVNWKQLKGWHMSPSHYLNQDLQDVWLDQ